MAASREVQRGRFPMPTVLLAALTAGRQRVREMATLGALYAAGFLLVLGLSSLIDGGTVARMHLGAGGPISREMVQQPDVTAALWLTMLAYIPLGLLFWHAPALVHWNGVPAVKSMFFSIVACIRNWRALILFSLGWSTLFLGMALMVSLLAVLLGNPAVAATLVLPGALLLLCMFFTSLYDTYRDCFGEPDDGPAPSPHQPPPQP